MDATKPENAEQVVSVRGLEKSYSLGESRVPVLSGLDLEVRRGELTAVMGPSGAGKSTLLNCLAGLDVPDRGQVNLLGLDLARLDEHHRTLARRRYIGVIYQFFNLVPNLDVDENLTLPFLIDDEAPDKAAIARVLERVGMLHRKKHLPSQLSGGELQLVSIARALVKRPRLILADEPTGNVNVATGKHIMALLREVLKSSDAALVMVTHNPEDAAKADRVVFLKDGRLDDEARLAGDRVTTAAIHRRLQELGI